MSTNPETVPSETIRALSDGGRVTVPTDTSTRGNEHRPRSKSGDGIPNEVYEAILESQLYEGSHFGAALSVGDLSGTVMDVRARQAEFYRTFASVSRRVQALALTVLWRYLVIRTENDIHNMQRRRDKYLDLTGVDLVTKTIRIDLRMQLSINGPDVMSMISLASNLKIFVHSAAGEYGVPHAHTPCRPDRLVNTLSLKCKKLIRVQFQSFDEEPTVGMVKTLLSSLPSLQTLHLDSFYYPCQGGDDNDRPMTSRHYALTTLSIGSIHRRFATDAGLDRAGVFLKTCIANEVLPALNSFYAQKLIPGVLEFIEAYGSQLREIGFALGEQRPSMTGKGTVDNRDYPHIMQFCPNIKSLLVFTTALPHHKPAHSLHPHKNLRSITVLFIDVPTTTTVTGGCGVLQLALGDIEACEYECLTEVTLHPVQAVTDDWYSHYLQGAVQRYERRGITVRVSKFHT